MLRGIFERKKTKEVEIEIEGMHCTSCAVNIDLSLEEIPGVKKVNTNYPKSRTMLEVDESKFETKKAVEAIKKLGYKARVI